MVAKDAVDAVATLRSDSTTPLRLNAVVAKDAVDAVPVKLPTKPPEDVVTPETVNDVMEPMPPITSLAVDAIPALPSTSGILNVTVAILPPAVAVATTPFPTKLTLVIDPALPTIEPSSLTVIPSIAEAEPTGVHVGSSPGP